MEVLVSLKSNLLPSDGEAKYYGQILSLDEADLLFQQLQKSIKWENDIVILFGKKIVTRRKVAWYGNAGLNYTYSHVIKTALLWTPELLQIKERVEQITGIQFNSCLLNLYHSGDEGMGWHSDDEKELQKDAGIASVSLGAARKFYFRKKLSHETKLHLILDHGSLLYMDGKSQQHWHHSLPVSKRVKSARINLTFRTIVC